MKIDIHAHVTPIETMGRAGRYGPELVETGDGRAFVRVGPYSSRIDDSRGLSADRMKRLHDPQVRIEEMDEAGIDVMGVSVSPLFYLYWAEPEIAVPFATIQNEGLAHYCQTDPGRLFFMATLPLPHIDESLEELERAAKLGAKGINIGTGGFGQLELDSKELWPIYEAVQELQLPLFVHPYPLPMADGAVDKYNMSWVVGYTYQETLAFATMFLGGVFDDFPGLRAIVTHGGGSVPYQLGRLEEARLRQPDVRASRPVGDYIKNNIYFDILIHDVKARRFLLDVVGPERLVLGDNFGGWDAVDGVTLLDELGLDGDTYAQIAGRNAAELFKLRSEMPAL